MQQKPLLPNDLNPTGQICVCVCVCVCVCLSEREREREREREGQTDRQTVHFYIDS